MQSDKNKKIGLLFMVSCSVLFFFFFWYFNLDGVKIDFSNLSLTLKMLFTTAFLPLGLYSGLYFYSGRDNANQIGGMAALLLVCAYIIGYLGAKYTPSLQHYFGIIFFLILIFGYITYSTRSIWAGIRTTLIVFASFGMLALLAIFLLNAGWGQ